MSSPALRSVLLLWLSMNMVSMAIYLQLYAKPFYIFFSHLKTIQSIFMKFSGDMGAVTLGSTLLSWGVHCYHGVNQNVVSMATYVMVLSFYGMVSWLDPYGHVISYQNY